MCLYFCILGSNDQTIPIHTIFESRIKKMPQQVMIWHRAWFHYQLFFAPSSTHMQDLQEVTQDLHYENFRSERLKRGGRLSVHGYSLPLSPLSLPFCLSFPLLMLTFQ